MAELNQWVGKWKLLPDSVEGFKEYAEAMKIPMDVEKKVSAARGNMTLDIRRGNDEGAFTIARDSGDGKVETTHLKLDQWFTILQNGIQIKNFVKLEKGKLFGEHQVGTQKSTSVRWLDGNKLHMETTGNGKTTKAVYQRV